MSTRILVHDFGLLKTSTSLPLSSTVGVSTTRVAPAQVSNVATVAEYQTYAPTRRAQAQRPALPQERRTPQLDGGLLLS